MESRLIACLAQGHGLATSAALRRAGFSSRQISGWVRTGVLVPVRRGVYTSAELWDSWDEYVARPLARIRAAATTIEIPFAFSHDSAAIVHGLPLLRPQDAAVHLTRGDMRATRVKGGIHHHGARFDASRVQSVGDLDVLDPARTVVDLAREHGYRAGLVAADGAMQLGIGRGQLRRAAREMSGWPFSLTVSAVVEDADPGAESVIETLGRELLMEAGLRNIETQFPVAVPGGVAWCDLRVGCHVVECDGRSKSRPVADGGLADRELERVLWDERRRQREVCSVGLGMSRLVWTDLWGEARERAKERVLREEEVTRRRFGDTLPSDLEEFARRMRGRRYRVAG